jgi:DNA primase catalytic subunit
MTKLRHCYPVLHRPAKIFERRRYYSKLDFGPMERWFQGRPDGLANPIFHLDPGNETRYFRREYKEKLGKLLYFEVEDFRELREMVMEYLPEDLYYDRNIYRDKKKCAECEKRGEGGCLSCSECMGQELMFDIDPENIDCPNCGTLEDRVRGASMFKFCYMCFNKAIEQTEQLHGWLKAEKGWNLSVVYSGRGFHIYAEGDEALRMSFEERKRLSKSMKEEGFAIDPWVTDGEARLARVPYSLNGLVSRICQPIKIEEIKKLDFWRSKRFVPDFV